MKALLISIAVGEHAIALFRETGVSFLFLDANAGSYRVPRARINEFLICHNEQCLPRKMDRVRSPWHNTLQRRLEGGIEAR